MKLYILLNHTLTPEQEDDAKTSLGVTSFVELPPQLKRLWGNIPCDVREICIILDPITTWLSGSADPGDYVLIQGDFGAIWLMTNWALAHGLVPIYSTTERKAIDQTMPNGSIQTVHNVRHCRFRKYGA